MARRDFQDEVESELTCSICLGTFVEPKLLQCFHVYCKGCLRRVPQDRNEQGKMVMLCPECRQETVLPENGVAGLKPAFHINRLINIMQQHKDDKEDSPLAGNVLQKSTKPHCLQHTDEELTLYCETCEEVICYKCAILGFGSHHNHKSTQFEVAFEEYEAEIGSSLVLLDKQFVNVENALKKIGECRLKIREQQSAMAVMIWAEKLRDVTEAQMINQLHQLTARKLQLLEAQEQQLKRIQAKQRSCLSFMKQNMKMDMYHDVLATKGTAVQRIKSLLESFQFRLLEPCVEADILYLDSNSSIASDVGREDKSGVTLFIKAHFPDKDDVAIQQSAMSITETVFACPANCKTQSYSSAILRLPIAFYYSPLTGIALIGKPLQQRWLPGSVLPHTSSFPASQVARRPVEDTFRPPHGNSIEYLMSVGYGKEVGLPLGMQEIYDPCTKKTFFLDHTKSKIIMDDWRHSPDMLETVQPVFIAGWCGAVETNMLPDLCTQSSVAIETSTRARSKPVGCTLSMRGRNGSSGRNGAYGYDGAHGVPRLGTAGGNGGPGERGGRGENGQRGGDAIVILSGSPSDLHVIGSTDFRVNLGGAEQILLVDCRGGDGGWGGTGGPGGRGGNGSSTNSSFHAKYRGIGGEGGRGGDSGDGGDSGAGGNCMIQTDNAQLLMLVEVDCMPGEPGIGVKGGTGGMCGMTDGGGAVGRAAQLTLTSALTKTYPGLPNGTQVRVGPSGNDGKPGSKAQNGGLLWVVLSSETGEKVQESSTRYDAKVESLKVSPALSDAIFEPNERIIVSGMQIHNTGGLDLPYGVLAFIPSTETVKFEPSRFYFPYNAVKAGQRYTIPFEFHGRIADLAPPNKPGPQSFKAEFYPRIELLGRPFEKSFLKQELIVRYPVQLGALNCSEYIAREGAGMINIEVRNISNRSYGNCTGSAGRVVLHLHLVSTLIPVSTGSPGNVDIPYVVTHDPNLPDSTMVELTEIPPGETVVVTIEVAAEKSAQMFHQLLWQVDLRLRDKLIEYNHNSIRVTLPYQPSIEPADVLFVCSGAVTSKEFTFWWKVLEMLGVSVDIWDTTQYHGFSVDNRTGRRHQNSWHGRYIGKMILYPHCNFQQDMAIEISQHFHGDRFHDSPLKELNSSFIAFMQPTPDSKLPSEFAILNNLAALSPTIKLPENAYSGRNFSYPPYASCEKQILKKLEDKNPAQAPILVKRKVDIKPIGMMTYSYGSIDVRRLPLLKSSKFLHIDNLEELDDTQISLDDTQLTSIIKISSKQGQAILATLYGIPIQAKLRLLRKKIDVLFYYRKDMVIGMEELVMITLAWEVADELFSCSGEASRMEMIFDDVKGNTTAYVKSGRTILSGLKLIAKEINKRKSEAGMEHFKTMQTYKKIVEMSAIIQKILSDAGVGGSKLENLITFGTLLDNLRLHCCHQHFVKDGRWNLIDLAQ